MDISGILVWLYVAGIFLGSIAAMAALGYVFSALYRWQERKIKGGSPHNKED